MKKFEPTAEQKECLKGMYLIYGNSMIPLDEYSTEVSAENFKALCINGDELKEVTVQDFQYYDENMDDYDFSFSKENYLYRTCVPTEVKELLDECIKKKNG